MTLRDVPVVLADGESFDSSTANAIPVEEPTFKLSLGGVDYSFLPQSNNKGSVAFESSVGSNETILKFKAFNGTVRVTILLENHLVTFLVSSGGVDMGFQLRSDLDLPLTINTGSSGSASLVSVGPNEAEFILRSLTGSLHVKKSSLLMGILAKDAPDVSQPCPKSKESDGEEEVGCTGDVASTLSESEENSFENEENNGEEEEEEEKGVQKPGTSTVKEPEATASFTRWFTHWEEAPATLCPR
jgi:hypothetical protein